MFDCLWKLSDAESSHGDAETGWGSPGESARINPKQHYEINTSVIVLVTATSAVLSSITALFKSGPAGYEFQRFWGISFRTPKGRGSARGWALDISPWNIP